MTMQFRKFDISKGTFTRDIGDNITFWPKFSKHYQLIDDDKNLSGENVEK